MDQEIANDAPQPGFIDPATLSGIKVPEVPKKPIAEPWPTCRTCPLSRANPLKVAGDRECRGQVGQMLAIPAMTPQGAGMQVNCFVPPVGPDFWCGEHPLIQARMQIIKENEVARLRAKEAETAA